MNEQVFLRKVIELYRSARLSVFPNRKIRRGRSHSIASAVEDLFAIFLIRNIDCDRIYVDQAISVTGKISQIYPDIVIVKSDEIKALCDVKMDLGWKRNELFNYCKQHTAILRSIRGKLCKVRDGITKEDAVYRVGRKAKLHVVIVSDQNINQKVLAVHLEKIRRLNKIVRVFILTKGEHPNTYGITAAQLLKKITINKEAFSSLMDALS